MSLFIDVCPVCGRFVLTTVEGAACRDCDPPTLAEQADALLALREEEDGRCEDCGDLLDGGLHVCDGDE